MEEVQQDMKSFGIDNSYKGASQQLDPVQQQPPDMLPQPSSSNEDFDPGKDYANAAAVNTTDAGGYTDFSNFGAFGSENNYAIEGANGYATDGAINYGTGNVGNYDLGNNNNPETGAGFNSFLDPGSDFSFFTSSFDVPAAADLGGVGSTSEVAPKLAINTLYPSDVTSAATASSATAASAPVSKMTPRKTSDTKVKNSAVKQSNSKTPNGKTTQRKTPSKTPPSKTPAVSPTKTTARSKAAKTLEKEKSSGGCLKIEE